ncbi:MAG: ABC transporter permease [Nocardioides sp.]
MSRQHVPVRTQLMEALVGVSSRPARLVLTMLGEALGLAALVATVGLAATANAQVSASFDRASARQVLVQPAQARAEQGATLPSDAERRVDGLGDVLAAGTMTRLDVRAPTRARPVTDPQGVPDPVLPVYAASVGLFSAVGAGIEGRAFDAGHVARADPVALLGASAARRLGVHDLADGPAVFIDGQALTVIGIVRRVSTHGELLDGVVVPETTAAEAFGWRGAASLVVDVRPRTADVVARQAPLAIAPGDPTSLLGVAPPTDTTLRARVQHDVSSLLLLLGIVTLLAGGVGIATIMLLSVIERVGEIGLRRCLGATRAHLMGQFLVESATIGLLGGIVGTSAGIAATMTVALVRHWTPVLEPGLLLAPLIGLVIGVLAGAFPAWRAGSLEPAEALRSL